jgi:hypothetical protein
MFWAEFAVSIECDATLKLALHGFAGHVMAVGMEFLLTFDKIPTPVRLIAFFGVLLIGPAMVASIMLGGVVAMIVTGMIFVFLFMVLYFFFVRNYL